MARNNNVATQIDGNDSLRHNEDHLRVIPKNVDYVLFSHVAQGGCHAVSAAIFVLREAWRPSFRRVLVAAIATYNSKLLRFIYNVLSLQLTEEVMQLFDKQFSLEFPVVMDRRSANVFNFYSEFGNIECLLLAIEHAHPELSRWV